MSSNTKENMPLAVLDLEQVHEQAQSAAFDEYRKKSVTDETDPFIRTLEVRTN